MPRRFIDPERDKFGLLVPVKEMPVRGSGRTSVRYWLFRCDCGNEKVIQLGSVTSGAVISCGCEHVRRVVTANTTHGESNTVEYRAYLHMHERCEVPTAPGYKDYGGRGITVCDEWCTYEQFIKDVGKRPSPSHSLERRDNNKGYCKDNVYWATPIEQQNNKRDNVILSLDGRSQTIAQWAREKGWSAHALTCRKLRGWTDERILTTPVRHVLKANG